MIESVANSKMTIELMTTSGCHLCDEASQMFDYLLKTESEFSSRFELQMVEIANDDRLIAEYGVRIPVLKSNKNELGWIFTLDELTRWLENL